MADESLKVGDIVELVDPDGDMPWPDHLGKRGVVHWLPDPNDPAHAGHAGVIVTFDDPDFTGVSTPQRHVRKVE